MDIRPYVLVGESRLRSWRARAQAAIDAWCDAWSIAPGEVTLECAPASAADAAWSWRAWPATGEGAAWLACEGDATLELVERLGGAQAPREALVHEVAALAEADLRATLEALVRGRCEADEPAVHLFAHGSGAITLVVHVGAASIALLAPLEPVEADAGGAREPLHAWADALGDVPLALQAEVAAVEIDAASLNLLATGDVIRLGTALGQPLALVAPDGTCVGRGHLGASHGRRALDLVG